MVGCDDPLWHSTKPLKGLHKPGLAVSSIPADRLGRLLKIADKRFSSPKTRWVFGILPLLPKVSRTSSHSAGGLVSERLPSVSGTYALFIFMKD